MPCVVCLTLAVLRRVHTQVTESDRKFANVCYHLDNHAPYSNMIVNDNVFPAGFHDYLGGQYVDGCSGYAQTPAQGQVRLTRGDKRPHFVLPPVRPQGHPDSVAPMPVARFASVHSPEADAGVRLADICHRVVRYAADCEVGAYDEWLLQQMAEHDVTVRSMFGTAGMRSSRRACAPRRLPVITERLLDAIQHEKDQLLAGGRVGNRIVMYTSDLCAQSEK